MKIYHERLNRDFESSDSNKKIQEVYERMLNPMLDEDATADAYKTLKAIMGAVKGSKDYRKNSIYHMSRGMMDSYKKNKGFSKDQAKWIYNISKAMFKKNESFDDYKERKTNEAAMKLVFKGYHLKDKVLDEMTLDELYTTVDSNIPKDKLNDKVMMREFESILKTKIQEARFIARKVIPEMVKELKTMVD